MQNSKKTWTFTLIAAALSFVNACVYPTVFIKWIIPLYAACVALFAFAAFFFFLVLFAAKGKEKPLIPALIGTAIYTALLLGVTPLVNNVIFGAVAPWGSVLANTTLNLVFWLVMTLKIRKLSNEPFVWKPLLCVLLVLAGSAVSVVTTLPNMKATGFIVLDNVKNYEERMDTIDIYENTMETALPQTEAYDMVISHLKAPLPEGKTEKKVLVLGWDGCRADAMVMKDSRGAVDALLADGGKAYIAYCGGANYPEKITQQTATGMGWTTILTGKWADEHGIDGFGDVKTSRAPTFLTTAIEDGLADSAAFCYSWPNHEESYANDIAKSKEEGLNVAWNLSEGEEGGDDTADENTFKSAYDDLGRPDCSDIIFTIFEYCDYYGHTYGFWNDTPEYAEAFKKSNDKGLQLINAVKARPTYETEDWLILITSDHGGYVRGHGGETLMERMMFIVTNK